MTHNINDVKTIQKYAILCQTSDFYNVKGKAEIGEKNIANLGKIWQRKVRKNYAKSFIHLPRQYLPFDYGSICFAKHGQSIWLPGGFLYFFGCHQPGGDWQRSSLWNRTEVKTGWSTSTGTSRKADDQTGL